MKNLLRSIVIGIFGLSTAAHAGLREDYSRIYSLETLKAGTLIRKLPHLVIPKEVMEDYAVRSDFDDINFYKQIRFDGVVFKVISFGDKNLENENDYVLSIFDQKGTLIGGCIATLNIKSCNLNILH